MKKNKELNARQIELFEEYYDINKEAKIVSYSLNFDKASDIFDSSAKKPLFNNDVLESINSLIEKAPFGYKVNINFNITDYQGYNPKEIITSFNDTLELNQYVARRSRQKKEILASNLILIGVILLFVMVITKTNESFGEGLRTEIASEVINIAAWVFIWEAVTMLFLEHSKQNIFALKIRRRVSQITMFQTNNNQPLAIEKAGQIFGNWENEGKIKRTGKLFTLLSSFGFLFLSFYSFYKLYLNILNSKNDVLAIIIYIASTIVSSLLFLCAGLGGISLYKEKNNIVSKFVCPYAILIFIIIITIMIYAIISNDYKLISLGITTTIINLLYIVGYIIEESNNVNIPSKKKSDY